MWHAHWLERNPNTGLWSPSMTRRASAQTEAGLRALVQAPPWETVYELGVDPLPPDVADVRGCLLPVHQRVWVRRSTTGGAWPVCEYLTLLVEPEPVTAAAPTISQLLPDTLTAGGFDVILRVYGTGFASRSQIVFNGGRERTWLISEAELQTVVNGASATTPGVYPVQVVTDPPGGGLSTSLDFTIEAV